MKRFFLLFFALFSLSCGIKQPVELVPEQQYGDIIVLSEPSGAIIYLDGQDTAQRTPDTLTQIPVGVHTIRTFLAEHTVTPDSIVVQVEKDAAQTVTFAMQKIETTGAVYITSQPKGAEIFLNNQPTGAFTPDTIRVESGDYNINIRKNGFVAVSQNVNVPSGTTITFDAKLTIQKCVLLEVFGNVSCTPCVEAADNLETFVDIHAPENYAIIEYYANWPSPNDPFYKEAPNDVMQRVMYYQLTSLPSMFISGAFGVDATQYENINQAYTTAFENWDSPFGLSITKTNSNGFLNVGVEVYQNQVSLDLQPYRLFVAIIEDDIQFDAAPGSNGLTHFNFVFRGFLSDKAGDRFGENASIVESYSTEWPDWNYANSHIVAFIQNIESKQIIHTTIN